MDRTSVVVLAVCVILLFGWFPMVNHFYPPPPKSTNQVEQVTSQTSTTTNSSTNSQKNAEAVQATASPAVETKPALPKPTQPEELLKLENEFLRCTFTSHGGGLKFAELKKHLEAVGSARRKGSTNSNWATLNRQAPLPVLAVLAGEQVQGDGVYRLSLTTNQTLRAEKNLTNGLVWIKEFRLGTNYTLEASVSVENLSQQPLLIPGQELVLGTATPMSAKDNNSLLMGAIDYDGAKAQYITETWFANRTLGCLPGTARTEYISGGTNVAWSAVHNQFFTLAVIPKEPAQRMSARRVDLPHPSAEEMATDQQVVAQPQGYQTSMLYPGLQLAPQQKVERHYTLFAGPKEYYILARLGSQLGNNLDLIMDYGGFWGFFARLLLLSMNGLHALGLGYGLTIIAITVIIKLVFWPLTQASTRSMKRMATLQPQMKAIQEKYKEDPKKMNLKLMEFMKENKVSPASGCLPMLIQIPVFVGFYKMLQSAIELRGAPFLWASDLSTSDTVWVVPGANFPVNPLPIFMAATMLWQARLTPPTPGADPVQQKIMKYMPLMFAVMLYNFSAGLTLYWTVQNLLTIAQMKLTKNDKADAGAPQPGVLAPKPGPLARRSKS